MPDVAPVVRILTAFGLLVFLVTASLSVYACLLTEIIPGSSWRARCLWRFGLAVVALSCAWVGLMVLWTLARAVGL